MLDLKGIAAYDTGLSRHSGANRKNENTGPAFSLDGGEFGSSSAADETGDDELNRRLVQTIEPETEVETYDFWGKTMNSNLLSGVNIDIVI